MLSLEIPLVQDKGELCLEIHLVRVSYFRDHRAQSDLILANLGERESSLEIL